MNENEGGKDKKENGDGSENDLSHEEAEAEAGR